MTHQINSHLPRLEAGQYQGIGCFHWTMTIHERRTGWLSPLFYYKYRELLTHAAFRYGIACPIFCLMPDHFHMLWIGINKVSDQLKASAYFRKQLNLSLNKIGFRLQRQAYDSKVSDEVFDDQGISELANYIARNPERSGIMPTDCFQEYSYTSCIIPGCPELNIWQDDYWERLWRSLSFARKNGLFRHANEQIDS